MHVRVFAAVALAASVIAGQSVSARAADSGSFDHSFAPGTRSFDARGGDDDPQGILDLPNGQILIGETSAPPASSDTSPTFIRLSSAGFLDSQFGGGTGVAIADLGQPARLVDFAVMSNNKIVGLAIADHDALLFRLNANGTLDSTADADASQHFGTSGVVTISLPLDTPTWNAVAVQGNGRVVVVGNAFASPAHTRQNVVVARFTATGSVDGTFDGGSVVVGLGGDAEATDVSLSTAGNRIIVAGTVERTNDEAIALLSLKTSDGSFDTAFSGDGKVLATLSEAFARDAIVTVLADGRLLVTATASQPGQSHPVVMRFNAKGNLDTAFANGEFHRAFSNDVSVQSVSILPSGRILLVTNGTVNLLRLLPSGALDPNFGDAGVVALQINREAGLSGGTVDAAGHVLLVWGAGFADSGATVIERLTSSAHPDATFVPGGSMRYERDIGLEDFANGVALDAKGRILIAGVAQQFSGAPDFAVLRLDGSGFPDETFHGGYTDVSFGSQEDDGFDVASDRSRVVVAGCVGQGATATFGIARFAENGTLDSGFSGDGRATTSFADGSCAMAVAVDSSRRIVAAGYEGTQVAIARYLDTGTLDHSFSGDGKRTTAVPAADGASIRDLAIQPDGKIVVAGTAVFNGTQRFLVMRYTTAGLLDTSFGGGDGIVTTRIGSFGALGLGVALRPDGRIIVAGSTEGPVDSELAIARYLPNGTLDHAFNGTGTVTQDIDSGDDVATSVASADGNKVVVVGYTGTGFMVVARFRSDGSLDSSFAGQGFREIAIGAETQGFGVAIQPGDGLILAAGQANDGQGLTHMAAARLLP